ncbi:MAG TPA: metal ABC transporter substrate-binding protein [Gaiellaceae bacterium]|nr:metal ABC transporter substrate-binding protein [Gaiellaceae bacterium]
MKRRALAAATAALLAGAGCAGTDERRPVVAAFYPLAFAAAEIAPPGTHVENLTAPGVEPHDLELSARDVRRVADAAAVLYLGEGFQPAVEDAIAATGARGVDLLVGLPLLEAGGDEHREAEGRDPHVWLDPVRYATIARRIGRELGAADRAEGFAARLGRLDAELRAGLSTCARRELVTSHAAFGYLAARYGLAQVPLAGLGPEAEATPRQLREVIREVREHGATTVFFETLVSPRLAQTVAREVGAETAVLNPLEGLTDDEVAAGEDYFSVMRANLAALRKGLGCS